jgi:hypothetical protein
LSQCLWKIWFVCNDISTGWTKTRTHFFFKLPVEKYFNVFKIYILQLKSHLESYDKDWKCPQYSAMRAFTFCLMLLPTLCTVCVITFNIQPPMFRFSSSRECGLFLYIFSCKYPHKKKSINVRGAVIKEGTVRAAGNMSVDALF